MVRQRSCPPEVDPPQAEKPPGFLFKMCWVYVLKSQKDGKLYIGSTRNLEKRIFYHNSGKVRSTKSRRPFEIIYSKRFDSDTQARKFENTLKTTQRRRQIKKAILEG